MLAHAAEHRCHILLCRVFVGQEDILSILSDLSRAVTGFLFVYNSSAALTLR